MMDAAAVPRRSGDQTRRTGAADPRASTRIATAAGSTGSGSMCRCIILISPAILFFLWMLSLSLKNELDNTAYPPVFIPHPPTLDNFIDVFAKNDFLTYTHQLGHRVVLRDRAGAAARRAGRLRHRQDARRRKAAVLILIARVTPGLSYLIPLFLMFQWLGMLGTLTPLIITHLVITVPIVVWIMIGYFEGLPVDAGGSRAGGRRHHLAGVPLCRGAAGAAGHHGRHDPVVHLQLEQLHLRRRAGRPHHAHACRSPSTTC